MGYVYFSPDKSYYSVPYRYIGKQTLVHYTKSTVEVYYNHQRIALHQRNASKGSYNTIQDHLSSSHRNYNGWSPEYFKNKAALHGKYVERCVAQIFNGLDYPEAGYKRVMGLLQLHKAYGSDRLDKACERALAADMVSYTRIRNILENNVDQAISFYNNPENQQSHIPKHGNVRGASAYQ